MKRDDSRLDPEQFVTVQKWADRLLKEADAYGRFPTPVGDLMSAAKVVVIDDEELTENFLRQMVRKARAGVATIKSALSKVLGLYHPNEQLVFVDPKTPTPKKPFVKLHEAGHATLPHQRSIYSLIHDCEKTLDADISDLFEREANVFASEVLFQGSSFSDLAESEPFSIKVPMKLARKYGASNYATFRRYVSTSVTSCAVVVINTADVKSSTFCVEPRRIIASRSFDITFDLNKLFNTIDSGSGLGRLLPIYHRVTQAHEIELMDRNTRPHECVVEAFNTTHQIFVLVRDVGELTKSGFVIHRSI